MGGTQLSSWMHDVLKIEVVFPMLAYDPAKLVDMCWQGALGAANISYFQDVFSVLYQISVPSS